MMTRRSMALVTAMLLAASLMAGPAAAKERGQPTDQHCVGHQSETKIEVPSGWDLAADGPYSEVVSVTDTRTGDPVEVTVTIDGKTATFASDDTSLEVADFCLKGGPKQTGALTGPSGTTESIPNRGGNAPDVSYVVLYGVTTSEGPAAGCGEGLGVEGGFEIYEAQVELGVSSGEFLFEYEALNQPDWFELFYDGERIFDVVSGTQANNPIYAPLFEEGGRFFGASATDPSYSNSTMVAFGDATSTSTQVTLRVTGSEPGTVWFATVNCPVEADA
jgi:hypothetical protein